MSGTTFEKYGGFSAVSRVVMTFYENVLDSDVVGHHFEDIDMPRLMDHQTKFISSLMGGPASISDERLRVVHQNIQITDAEFDEVMRLLADALTHHGVEDRDVAEIGRLVEGKRSLIVRRNAA